MPIPNAVIQYNNSVISSGKNGVFHIEYADSLNLKISAIGFNNHEEFFYLTSNVERIFVLPKISHDLGQVVIEEEGSKYENSKTINQISTLEINQIPSAAGVSDIFSTLKTQPGVQSNTEGQKGLIIRGGNYDQSTTYVDGVPIVGSSHLFGLLSMFQTDCIEEVNLYNGYKPLKYGGTLGSAIEINLSEEFSKEGINSGSIKSSFISTQVQTIFSDQNTFVQLGLRNSNLFLIQGLIDAASQSKNPNKIVSPVYSFNDASLKVSRLFNNHKFGLLYLKSYDGVDYDISFLSEERRYSNKMDWHNEAIAFKWHYFTDNDVIIYADIMATRYNSGLYSNNRIHFWDVDQGNRIWRNSVTDFDNTIDNIISTVMLDKTFGNERLIQFGFQYKTTEVTPDSYEYWEDDPVMNEQDFIGNKDVETFTLFVEHSGDFLQNSSYNLGCRTSMFKYAGKKEVHFNPRFLFTSHITDKLGLNFYSLSSSQNIHLVSLNSFGFIPELWVAPNASLPVERSWTTGIKFHYNNKKTSVFLDSYLIGMSGLLEFSENVDFNNNTSQIVENGISAEGLGSVVGIEFSLKSHFRKLSYNLSYAYGKSSRRFDDLNSGNAFPFAFDIRHNGSLALSYDISEQISVSTLYTYSTGRMLNIQNQLVPVGFTTPLGGSYSQWVAYTQPLNRNSYRLGDIHRLDFAVSWYKYVSYGIYSIQLGAYNITNKINPYSAIVRNDQDGNQTIEEVGLIPILPNLTISLKWN